MSLLPSLLLASSLVLANALPHIPRASNSTTNSTTSVVFDARIKAGATPKDFDSDTGPFRPDNVLGQGLKFSDLVVLPQQPQSLVSRYLEPPMTQENRINKQQFDKAANTQAFEVTLSDKSIFVPGGSQPQSAIRRAELLPNTKLAANNITTTGVRTLHFSLMSDPQRPLNLSHEYQMVFLETADFSANQFILKTGTLIGSNNTNKNNLVLTGSTKASSPVLFSTAFTPNTLHNFAMKLDFTKNNVQVFYSTNNDPLKAKTKAISNDLSGNGDLHVGLFKKSTDPGADPKTTGFQESGINEGVIFAGVFMEDSANGQVTLS